MKAKIQFTVDIEDIPKEVLERIKKLPPHFNRTTEKISSVMDDIEKQNIVLAVNEIDVIRKELAHYDSVLEDCYSILVGYANYQAKQLELKEETPIPIEETIKND